MPLTLNGTSGITTPAGLVINNAPAFSAYQSSSQTISGGVATKITFTTEEFDTNSNYDTTTSRFTPTVAGYYQIDAAVSYQNATAGELMKAQIYKNGTSFKVGGLAASTATQGACSPVSALISMNGSTDYVEVYIFASGLGGTTPTNATANSTYFQGVLVRST